MFITVHVATAVVISETISSRIIGFVAGVISHLFLDFFPHGDKGLKEWVEKTPKQKTLKILFAALTDVLFVWVFAIFAMKRLPISNPEVAYWTAVGSAVPDLIWGFYIITGKRIKPLGAISKLHDKIQNVWKDNLSLKSGIAIQIPLLLLLIWAQINIPKL